MAGKQAVNIAVRQKVIAINKLEVPVHAQTLCIHGDTPGAAKIVEGVAKALRAAGVAVEPL